MKIKPWAEHLTADNAAVEGHVHDTRADESIGGHRLPHQGPFHRPLKGTRGRRSSVQCISVRTLLIMPITVK